MHAHETLIRRYVDAGNAGDFAGRGYHLAPG